MSLPAVAGAVGDGGLPRGPGSGGGASPLASFPDRPLFPFLVVLIRRDGRCYEHSVPLMVEAESFRDAVVRAVPEPPAARDVLAARVFRLVAPVESFQLLIDVQAPTWGEGRLLKSGGVSPRGLIESEPLMAGPS